MPDHFDGGGDDADGEALTDIDMAALIAVWERLHLQTDIDPYTKTYVITDGEPVFTDIEGLLQSAAMMLGEPLKEGARARFVAAIEDMETRGFLNMDHAALQHGRREYLLTEKGTDCVVRRIKWHERGRPQ